MKQRTKRIASVLLVLCMVVSMLFANVPQALAAEKYKKSVTKTFTLPPYTQYGIWVELDEPGFAKATVTSKAKKAKDRAALVAFGSGNGEEYIDAEHKKVSLSAGTGDTDENVQICLYLTNGSDKKVKYTVKFTGVDGRKVKYVRYDDNGEGAG